jgi:uncharacterized membrane protein
MASALSVFEGDQNLSFQERALSVVIGLGLAAAGAKPRPNPLLNVLALAAGSLLAIRGATGHCPVKAALAGPDGQARLVPLRRHGTARRSPGLTPPPRS